jgi:hypothetical protein
VVHVVEFDNKIINLQTGHGRQHMFDGIYLRLTLLEGRAAIQSYHMIYVSRYFGHTGEISAHKADAGTGRSGLEGDCRLAAGMQADS